MNSCQDYLLFPLRPTTDWTTAALASAQYQSARETMAPGASAAGDTPLQMRVAQIVPQSHYYDSGVNRGLQPQPATNSQTEHVRPLTYAQALKSSNVTAKDRRRCDIKERLAHQQNLVRIQNALHRGAWAPDGGHLPANAVTWNVIRQMDSYLGNLHAELMSVHEPLERCLRVGVCITTLMQKYNCLNNSVALDCLQASFGAQFRETFQPCLAAIKAQATAGYAKDYFEVFYFILNFLQYYPDASFPGAERVRSEITATLSGMVEVELDYLQYALGFPRHGNNFWLISNLKRWLGADDLFRRLQLVDDQTAQAYLQKLQALECSPQDPDPELANLDAPHKIDLLIAKGSLKAASDLLAAGDCAHPFQVRLMYEILKHECLQVVMNHQLTVSAEQELAQLIGLNLFVKIYQPFISSHFFLFHHVRMLLSDLVGRVLTCHKIKISHHEKRQEVETIINELANSQMLSDQCLSLWWTYRHSVLPIEDSLMGTTSRDGFVLCKVISRRLSSGKAATDTDYRQAAQLIRRWIINENILLTMDLGLQLVKELNVLRHKLYLHFFHKIFHDGFVKSKHDLVGYRRVIEVMDQHRSSCLKNQDMLFLLKGARHRFSWQQIACQAWGKLICDLQKKIICGQVINEAELDEVLSLGTVSPLVEHELTNIDLKKLVIIVFKAAVCQPDIIRINYHKLQCLAHWILAIIDTDSSKLLESPERNDTIRKAIFAYFGPVHRGHGAVNQIPSFLAREVVRRPMSEAASHGIALGITDMCRGKPGQAVAPYIEINGELNQPMRSYEALLLSCAPASIIIKNDYDRLYDSLRRISAVLHDILSRGVTDYEAIAKKDLDYIDLCLANLAPWFRQFCSQAEAKEFSGILINLTKSNSNGDKIHQTFSGLAVNRIRQGDISGAANIICVQQALCRIRSALGLPTIG